MNLTDLNLAGFKRSEKNISGFSEGRVERRSVGRPYFPTIGPSARLCIRQALGQLMEYGFWPGAAGPAKLFVVGEPPLDGKAEKFLQSLREKFKIPIYYRQVVIGN